MGTLDDAIRQHLELKRRAGAPDEEVTRLESEAFGAGRREPPPSPIEGPDEPSAGDELPPPPPAAATSVSDPVLPPPTPAPPSPAGDSWLDDEEDLAEPELPPAASQATSEFTAREVREAQEGPPASDYVAPDEEGDDLLEETPDFLQETPEHDRLWFEQKPPRNFDFDA